MPALTWDNTGERLYETGVEKCVLFIPTSGVYDKGYAWNGVTGITESPSGAEESAIYADDIKYLSLRSKEEFGATITAYMYPDEFAQCDGSASIATGVVIGQQKRSLFGLCYKTLEGNDTDGEDHGYKIHLIYGCTASPSERAYATTNDSPEAIEFSWEITTVPVKVDIDGQNYKDTAVVTIDSTTADATKLAALEKILYGSEDTEPRMPLPGEIATLMKAA